MSDIILFCHIRLPKKCWLDAWWRIPQSGGFRGKTLIFLGLHNFSSHLLKQICSNLSSFHPVQLTGEKRTSPDIDILMS